MGKRSSFNNPRWINKKDNSKLHKMGIDHFIDIKMIEMVVYTCTYRESNFNDYNGFLIKLREKQNDEITVSDIEEEIRHTLKWQGLDFFEKMEYEERDKERLEHAKEFVRKKFPRWFQDNAKHFMTEA